MDKPGKNRALAVGISEREASPPCAGFFIGAAMAKSKKQPSKMPPKGKGKKGC